VGRGHAARALRLDYSEEDPAVVGDPDPLIVGSAAVVLDEYADDVTASP
jgi:hypothetical protein